MKRKARRTRRPPPIGAVFLLVALICVLAIIFWPRHAEDPADSAVRNVEPDEAPIAALLDSSRNDRPGPAERADLQTLVRRLLDTQRIDHRPGGDAADLVASVPPGRSLFALNGQISHAAALWGGRVESGVERQGRAVRKAVDLRLVRGREAVTVRLAAGDRPEGFGRIALVIDDFGFQSEGLIEEALRLPIPFTPSVLPGYKRSEWALRRAIENRRAVLLHLPMEPLDAKTHDPGREALRVGMDREEIRSRLSKQLASLEGVVGVNHHMGSRASGEPSVVGPVLDFLAERGLFYLDSGTSDHSVCAAEAAKTGTPCLVTDLFLDGAPDWSGATMPEKLKSACRLARSNGSAIMIAHVRPATVAFLADAPDTVAQEGCRFVPLTDLLR